MGPILRLIRLHCLARLRAAGWLPWLAFAGWMVIARFQEPTMLRRYGIALLDDAAWSAGLVLLIVMFVSERRLPQRFAWLGNLVVLAAIAAIAGAACWLLDRGAFATPLAQRLGQVAWFFVSWLPLTLVLSAPLPFATGGRILAVLMSLAALVLGSMLAVAFRAAPDGMVGLGATLSAAAGAAGAWTIRSLDRRKSL